MSDPAPCSITITHWPSVKTSTEPSEQRFSSFQALVHALTDAAHLLPAFLGDDAHPGLTFTTHAGQFVKPLDPSSGKRSDWRAASQEEWDAFDPKWRAIGPRCKASCTAVHMLALEHDAGTVKLAHVHHVLSEMGSLALIYSSKSHTPAAHRLRILIALSRAVSLAEREILWRWASRVLADLQLAQGESHNAVMFWFWPSLPTSGDPFEWKATDGNPINVDALIEEQLAREAQDKPAPAPPPPLGALALPTSSRYGTTALENAYKELCQTGTERHGTLARVAFKIGGLVGSRTVTYSEAEQALQQGVRVMFASEPGRIERDGYRTIRDQLARGQLEPIYPPARYQTPAPKRSAQPMPKPTTTDAAPASSERPALRVVGPDEQAPLTDRFGRPVIHVRKGELPRMCDQAVAALTAAPDLYTREGSLVHVAHATADQAAPAIQAGAPRIYPVTPPGLTERLSHVASWQRSDRPDDPPPMVVGAVLARRVWPALRPLAGIVQAPTLRPDGSLITAAGYDPTTAMLYAPSEAWPEQPDDPTPEDARQALADLLDAFCDFPWETTAGPSCAVAALLTVLARPAVLGAVPAFVFDANSPASGKTLVADTIATIATGREAGRHSYPQDPKGSDAEISKALTAYAMAGTQIVCFDNLSPDNVFGGPAIESVLTARDTASFRILGKSEVVTLPWRTVVLATGNNVEVSRDCERRALVPRFLARWETADARPLDTFVHQDRVGCLVQWARFSRGHLVTCALTLLRAYFAAGRPSQGLRWASFEEWTELVPSAIVWAGGASPLAARPADTGRVSPERAALMVVLRDWPRLDPEGNGVTIKAVLALLYPELRHGEQQPPDGFDELRGALEDLAPIRNGRTPDPVRLSGAFRRTRQVAISGRAIEAGEKARTWRVAVVT